MISSRTVILPFVLALAIALFVLPRKKLLGPFFLAAVFVPLAQGFDIAGLNITIPRFLVFTVWIRFLVRRELAFKQWNAMDTAVVVWCSIGAVAYVLLWGTFDAFINRMGQIVNYAGTYFLVRLSVSDATDLARLTNYMRLAVVVLGVFIIEEALSGRNLFSALGAYGTMVRDGVVRCRGPFGHSINTGLFGASMVPIFLGSIVARDRTIQNLVALTFGLLIVILSGSSTPVGGLAAGVVAWVVWPWRRNIRMVTWGAAAAAALAFMLVGSLWQLFTYASVYEASTGVHRYELFNAFITRIDEWWLFGTRDNAQWGLGLDDVANNYVSIGINGGLFTLLAFLLLLWCGFKSLGAAMRLSGNNRARVFLWSLGASLLVHIVGFFGISYWDQIVILFALLLGLISAASSAVFSQTELRQGTSRILPTQL